MRGKAVLLCLACTTSRASAAETGDFDGDGRLSIGDVVHALRGWEPAPGSYDAFDVHPCDDGPHEWDARDYHEPVASIIYFESLRRNLRGTRPAWLTVWDPALDVRQPPLPDDPLVEVTIGDATASGLGDRVKIPIRIETSELVRGYSLILEADGDVLRVPLFTERAAYPYSDGAWNRAGGDIMVSHLTGDVATTISPATYLLTAGRFVLSNFDGTINHGLLGPGEVPIDIELRLRRGAPAGVFNVRLLPGSEVLLADGSLVAPHEARPGQVTIQSEVSVGWDEGLPPLQIDAANRRVLGKVEFRLADDSGKPAQPGEAVAEALPGDAVSLRVQMRTEVPLNSVTVRLHWPGGALECNGDVAPTWINPEDGSFYTPVDKNGSDDCTNGVIGLDGRAEVDFSTVGGRLYGFPTTLFKQRPLEYFKPLNEWVDVFRVNLTVPPAARGGTEVPLTFLGNDPRWWPDRSYFVGFSPYAPLLPCDQASDSTDNRPPNWSYDVSYEGSTVRILGEDPGPGPDPVDAGIRFLVGEGAARPGEEIEVPIFAAAETRLSALRLVLETDAGALDFGAIDVEVLSLATGELVRRVIDRGASIIFQECIDLEDGTKKCGGGVPFYSINRDVRPDAFFLDLIGLVGDFVGRVDYPGPELREIAKLRVRVREDVQAAEVVLRPTVLTWRPQEFDAEAESGGFLQSDIAIFSPASAVRPGTITILGRGFLRGDANHDARVDLSDAVATLNYLFSSGSEPGCLDAADADDSGKVEITDPIFLLGALFLGTKTIPAPYPICGSDASADELSCQEGCR